jgi:hypothetical protein
LRHSHGYRIEVATDTQKQLTDTQGRSDTYGVQVTVSAGISIPIFASFNVTVQGSASFTQNGSTSSQVTFSWQQPVIVPDHDELVATGTLGGQQLGAGMSGSGNGRRPV